MDEMREKGQTLRSKDLSGGLLLASAILMIVILSGTFKSQFEHNFILSFESISTVSENQEHVYKVFRHLVLANFMMLIPVMIMMIAVVFGSVFILGGWNFSLKALRFKWENINPAVNLGNIYSSKMIMDVTKSSIKFIILVGFTIYFIHGNMKDLLSIPYLSLGSAMVAFFYLIEKFVLVLFTGILMIVCIDALTSYLTYQSKSKMSTQDMKDEQKDTEGNADVKRKLRSLQFSLAKQKIPQMVPLANVIVTNPTHYAVALRYKEGVDKAPKVIAKGKGAIAQYIRKLAISNGIPIYEEPPLARAIYHTSKLGSDVNPALYLAVAIVLTYIHQLRRYQQGQGPLPVKSTNLDIPEAFHFKG
jgi:flagellar biosynthetic protein FlhB